MSRERFISTALADAAVRMLVERIALEESDIATEFQDDFQLLLIAVPCERVPEISQNERRELGLELDKMMPRREGALTWMLNFTLGGRVVDSYFGGDSMFPQLGL